MTPLAIIVCPACNGSGLAPGSSPREIVDSARMVAAAPKMLSALQVARTQIKVDLDAGVHKDGDGKTSNLLVLEIIEDALRKAART